MQVFSVLFREPYEIGALRGVFSSRELAVEFVQRQDKNSFECGEYLVVASQDVVELDYLIRDTDLVEVFGDAESVL